MASIVYVKNPNGKTYAYENISYWDKELKKTKHKRKCVGHLDDLTGKIVPNNTKGLKTPSEKNKHSCIVMGNGISLLLDKVAEEIGLLKILKKVFSKDWQQILTCAYYLVSEGNALCHAEKWLYSNVSPCKTPLTSQRISELLSRIDRSLQNDFFKAWINHNSHDEYFALDITSVSSYSEFIDFVKHGYNRDGETLPQINMLMVSGENSHMPLYYQVIPGSIKDVKTLKQTLEQFECMKIGKLRLVMDKGFYSKDNIDALYDARMKFSIGVPFTVGFACEQVTKAREEDIMSHENYRMIFDDEVFVKSRLTKWNGHRLYVHVYFDSLKAELAYKKFNQLLFICYKELESGETIKSHESYYNKYFVIKETPKRGRKIEYNQSAINDYRQNTNGWFVMITNDIKDPIKALEIYRRKDTVEKSFDNSKNDLDCKRLRMHSSRTMDGRLFIQFIALILCEKIQSTMNKAGWFKNYSMQDLINEMKSLREISIVGNRKKYNTVPTAFQERIAELFNLRI